MILSDKDVARRRAELLALKRDDPVMTGHPAQYFFTFKMNEGELDGICGINTIILDVRRDPNDPQGDMFYADLGVESHLPDFWVEYLNVPVTSVSFEDEQGNKSVGFCHFPDLEVVMKVMNAKFRVVGKPALKLVVDNELKKE